ncbi:hypothetical protein EG327_006284 [Venturia inaequalis]|uniref:RRM domain-containing protein n=1 Tax=Venturia inaequalis TaxID=5025 RepID=A0A8H3V523_VENIN|nr:hypothetical protein EG327_006284 [Venturia inaequalis]
MSAVREPGHLETQADVSKKQVVHLIHGRDVARAILACHQNFSKVEGYRWIITDLFVYDWWTLMMDWGGKLDDGTDLRTAVFELMEETGVKALPRDTDDLGRRLDSREFLLRRAASRAIATKPSTNLLSQQRSIITAARPALVSRQQWFATSFQKRFASDEVKPTDSEAVVQAEASETAPEETAPEVATAADATSEVTGQGAAATQFSNSEKAPSDFVDGNPHGNVLYVGNLFFEVTEDALQRLFSEHGEVQKVKLIYDHRGLSKGFGYVTFSSAEEANKATDALNQQPFHGRRLSVQPHQPRERLNDNRRAFDNPRVNNPSKTLFIGNMSFDMSDKDLNDLFRDVKNVVDVRVAIDRRTGQPRGFAHCDLLDIESATKAKEILSGKDVHGRQLRVDFSQSTADRPQGDFPPRRNSDNNGPPRERRNYDNNGPPRRNYDNNGPPRRNYDNNGPPRERRSYDNNGPPRERRNYDN